MVRSLFATNFSMLLAAVFVLANDRVPSAAEPAKKAAEPAKKTAEPAAQPAATTEREPPPLVLAADTVVTKDIYYGDDKARDAKSGEGKANDAHLRSLDVYAPKGAKNLPVVVFVHGGGWTRGDRAEVGSQPKLFNSQGLVLVSVDYRLSPAHRHPAHVNDVAAAIAWTAKNIDQYGGDGQRIVVMGHSAGSHLAALVAADPRPLAQFKLKPSDLAGVNSLDGSAFDIVDRIAKGTEKLAENCRRAFGPDDKDHRDASPLHHVKQGAALPPFLLVYVKPDSLNHTQSKDLGEKVQASGGKSELVVIDGKDHFTLAAELGAEGNANADEPLLKFIRAVTARK